MKKLILMSFSGGVILGSGGSIDLPVTVLPSLGFIVLAYVGLAVWDLRDVLQGAIANRLARSEPAEPVAPTAAVTTRPVTTIGAPTPV